MNRVLLLLLVIAFAFSPARNQCRCQKLAKGGPEMGNVLATMNGGRVRRLRGTAFYPNLNQPVKEAVVEVYENHSGFTDANIPSAELEKIIAQERKVACMTAADGKFCFDGLPGGRYLLRVGTHGEGWVSGVYVLVTLDPKGKRSSQKQLKITLNMSL